MERDQKASGNRISYNSFSEELKHISGFILTHHERWDGAGYPHKLKGLEIPKLARIFFIVDSYVVMTSLRPYKSKLSQEEAIYEIRSCAGTQFDPELVDIITEFLMKGNIIDSK